MTYTYKRYASSDRPVKSRQRPEAEPDPRAAVDRGAGDQGP